MNSAACGTAGLAGGPTRQGTRFELRLNGPGRAVARVALASPGPMRLTIHDMGGRELARMADSHLPVGIYFFRLRAAGTEIARARVLAR